MFKNYKRFGLIFVLFVLIVILSFLFYIDWQNSHRKLTFAMLDMGQGDALFIESPTGTQILVDAGPPKKVLSKLARVMPFFDKSIDAIIITNPDQDHIGGITDILKVYKVGKIFESGTTSDSRTYKDLKSEIKNKNIKNLLVKKGMSLDIGGGARIDIIFPDRDVSLWETNDGSTVARLVYGDTRVMLTGDATKKTESLILESNKREELKSDILKVGHHGSHTSTSEDFLKAVAPEYDLISLGKDNKYGHPHKDILELLGKYTKNIFRTDELGTIVLKSDGKNQDFSFIK